MLFDSILTASDIIKSPFDSNNYEQIMVGPTRVIFNNNPMMTKSSITVKFDFKEGADDYKPMLQWFTACAVLTSSEEYTEPGESFEFIKKFGTIRFTANNRFLMFKSTLLSTSFDTFNQILRRIINFTEKPLFIRDHFDFYMKMLNDYKDEYSIARNDYERDFLSFLFKKDIDHIVNFNEIINITGTYVEHAAEFYKENCSRKNMTLIISTNHPIEKLKVVVRESLKEKFENDDQFPEPAINTVTRDLNNFQSLKNNCYYIQDKDSFKDIQILIEIPFKHEGYFNEIRWLLHLLKNREDGSITHEMEILDDKRVYVDYVEINGIAYINYMIEFKIDENFDEVLKKFISLIMKLDLSKEFYNYETNSINLSRRKRVPLSRPYLAGTDTSSHRKVW